MPVWVVSIRDPADAIEYQDAESHFNRAMKVYWYWDTDDRLWLYNSDDGRVWYWELVDGRWTKNPWDGDKPSLPRPPRAVYPPYAKK